MDRIQMECMYILAKVTIVTVPFAKSTAVLCGYKNTRELQKDTGIKTVVYIQNRPTKFLRIYIIDYYYLFMLI